MSAPMRAAVFWLLVIMLVLWDTRNPERHGSEFSSTHCLEDGSGTWEPRKQDHFDLIVWSILAVPLACLVLIAKPR